MNREIVNKIYHALTFYGIDRKKLSLKTDLRDDLNLSSHTLIRIFMILQKKTGVRLLPVAVHSPTRIYELANYIDSHNSL